MNDNQTIKCDVKKCKHNKNGCNCALDSIKVTCSCDSCTCCDDFCEE